MFKGLKVGGALRAKAFAKLQADNAAKHNQAKEDAERVAKGLDPASEDSEWDLPDPRTDWEVTQLQKQEAAEKHRVETEARMNARAAAAGAQAERRRQYTEASSRAEQERPATAPGAGQSSTGAENGAPTGSSYVPVFVTYRGLSTPSKILLTADEYGSYTVRGLKRRVSRESGIQAHAEGKLILTSLGDGSTTARTGAETGHILIDDMPLRTCVRANDHLTLKIPEKENTRPQSASTMTSSQRAERMKQLEADALWRGHRKDTVHANFDGCTTAQLTKFVKQAGGSVEDSWTPEELIEAAKGWAGEWEVNRVLMCQTDWEVLRLADSGAPLMSEVKSAFRKASMQVHPDKNQSTHSTEAMRRVSKAYSAMMSRAVTA